MRSRESNQTPNSLSRGATHIASLLARMEFALSHAEMRTPAISRRARKSRQRRIGAFALQAAATETNRGGSAIVQDQGSIGRDGDGSERKTITANNRINFGSFIVPLPDFRPEIA